MARFILNPTFNEELEREPKARAHFTRVANGVARKVRVLAPRNTGYYVRHVETRGPVVGTTDPFGHLTEWGSKNNPPYAPIRRGVRAAGLSLDERPKL